jgi:hypothetical protein
LRRAGVIARIEGGLRRLGVVRDGGDSGDQGSRRVEAGVLGNRLF